MVRTFRYRVKEPFIPMIVGWSDSGRIRLNKISILKRFGHTFHVRTYYLK